MKTLKILVAFVFIGLLSSELREWTDLDTLRGPNHRWSWIRSEVVLQPRQKFDFVFTGSSKTLNGVKPTRLAESLPGTRSINLAHFKYGHDADYFALRDLLERHEVGMVVVELPWQVVSEPHEATTSLIGSREFPGEVAAALGELDAMDYLTYSDSLKAGARRLSGYLGTLVFSWPVHGLATIAAALHGEVHATAEIDHRWDESLGFDWRDAEIVPNPHFLKVWSAKGTLASPRRPEVAADGQPDVPAPGSRQDRYLRRLKALTEQYGVRLAFVQVPSLLMPPPSLERYAYYRRFGPVLIPDLASLHQLENYADAHHLYGAGAVLFTDELARLLRNGPEASPYFELYRNVEDASP